MFGLNFLKRTLDSNIVILKTCDTLQRTVQHFNLLVDAFIIELFHSKKSSDVGRIERLSLKLFRKKNHKMNGQMNKPMQPYQRYAKKYKQNGKLTCNASQAGVAWPETCLQI